MEYNIIRSRRRTIAIEIDRQGRITVRAPYNVGNLKIKQFINDKSDWIERTLKRVNDLHSSGNDVTGKDSPDENGIFSTDHKKSLSADEIKALTEEAKMVIPPKVSYYAGIIGVSYGRITIRNQKTRWGSCSSKGNLNFNCLLMQAPEEILDYVIIHELCHRLEMNHSKKFWEHVSKACPDYKARRKWLREHAEELSSLSIEPANIKSIVK